MAVYVIGYDLTKPGQDYADLFEAIKGQADGWWHCLDSTWIINSAATSVAIRDALTPHMDASDRLLVAKLSGEAAWIGFDEQCSKWLSDNL